MTFVEIWIKTHHHVCVPPQKFLHARLHSKNTKCYLKLNCFCLNHGDHRVFSNLNHQKCFSVSFEYLCYGSATIGTIQILSVRGPSSYMYVRISRLYKSESDVDRFYSYEDVILCRIKTVPALKVLINGFSVTIHLKILVFIANTTALNSSTF